MTRIGADVGKYNRDRVLAWLSAHPGGKQAECAKSLGLSVMAVGRHFRSIRQSWSDSAMPPPVEGYLATRRHWIIVHEPGRIPQKKGAFRFDQILPFLRELMACRSAGTRYTVISLTWDYDIWAESGHEMVAEDEALKSLTDADWADAALAKSNVEEPDYD